MNVQLTNNSLSELKVEIVLKFLISVLFEHLKFQALTNKNVDIFSWNPIKLLIEQYTN